MENVSIYNEDMEPKSQINEAVKLGLIWSAISIILFLITFYAFPNSLASPTNGIISLVINIGLAVYFTLELRKKFDGYWSFSVALKHIFVLFLVQTVLVSTLSIAFFKFVESDSVAYIKESSMNSIVEMYENMGMSQEQIDMIMDEMDAQMEKSFNPTVGEFFQGLAISVIMYFVGALIFAAIFKRNKPVFQTIQDDEEVE